MRIRLALLVTLMLSVAPIVASAADNRADRFALVIGNSKYPDAEAPLKEPINDARALTAFLMSQYWLSGSTLTDWRSLGQYLYLYAWQRPDNTSVVFAWATDGQSAPLSTNANFTITDIFGHSLQPTSLGPPT